MIVKSGVGWYNLGRIYFFGVCYERLSNPSARALARYTRVRRVLKTRRKGEQHVFKRKEVDTMELSVFFKSIIDQDLSPVVVCDKEHTIVYMNPASISRYHADLTGKSLMDCHNADSCEKIEKVLKWFKDDKCNNRVYTYRNDKENKDVYMVALRDESGELIGYYEKHEYTNRETAQLYNM